MKIMSNLEKTFICILIGAGVGVVSHFLQKSISQEVKQTNGIEYVVPYAYKGNIVKHIHLDENELTVIFDKDNVEYSTSIDSGMIEELVCNSDSAKWNTHQNSWDCSSETAILKSMVNELMDMTILELENDDE